MARKSLKVKAQKTPKFSTRRINRCFQCGRKRSYMRDFDLCHRCFRETVAAGYIPGVHKSSW